MNENQSRRSDTLQHPTRVRVRILVNSRTDLEDLQPFSGQLYELLKDSKQNGHRTIQQIVKHMSSPLVLWGWHPGEDRSPVPVPQSEFLAKVKEWAAKGAARPADNAEARRGS